MTRYLFIGYKGPMTPPPVREEAKPVYTWGSGVRALRGLKQITQTRLAALTDTTQSRISDIENGSRNVPDALRLRIARTLEVDPYELFPYEEATA